MNAIGQLRPVKEDELAAAVRQALGRAVSMPNDLSARSTS